MPLKAPIWEMGASNHAEARTQVKEAQLAEAIARRKAIYEALHPETAYEARPGRAGKCRQTGDNSDPVERFTAATAAATGMSERSARTIADSTTVAASPTKAVALVAGNSRF